MLPIRFTGNPPCIGEKVIAEVSGISGIGGIAFSIFPVGSEGQVDDVFRALHERLAGCEEVSRIFSPDCTQAGFDGSCRWKCRLNACRIAGRSRPNAGRLMRTVDRDAKARRKRPPVRDGYPTVERTNQRRRCLPVTGRYADGAWGNSGALFAEFSAGSCATTDAQIQTHSKKPSGRRTELLHHGLRCCSGSHQ